MMNYDGHFFGGGFMWILWIIITVGVFYLIQNIIKGKTPDSFDNETPMDILNKRYARGEIDHDEYEKRRKELES